MTGLLRPSQGSISVLGMSPDHPEQLFRFVGYCTQFDSFPRGMTGYQFVYSYLRLYGKTDKESAEMTWHAHRARETDRRGAPQDRRLQQGHAAAHQAGAGHCALPAGAGAGRTAQRPRPAGARRDHRAVSRACRRRAARHHLQPHPARSGCHLRPGDSAEQRLRGGRRPDSRRARRRWRSTPCRF